MSQEPYYAAGGNVPIVQSQAPAGIVSMHDPNHVAGPKVQVQYATNGVVWTKGEKQPKRCNDAFFAILFYAHLGAMLFVAIKYIPQVAQDLFAGFGDFNNGNNNNDNQRRLLLPFSEEGESNFLEDFARELEDGDNNDNNFDWSVEGVALAVQEILLLLVCTSIAGSFFSALTLTFMNHFAESLIKFSLLFNLFTALLLILAGVLASSIHFILIGSFIFLFTACYAYMVWSRIPFAAINLVTALTSVRANSGLTFYAYTSMFIMFLWSILWFLTFTACILINAQCYLEDGAFQCERNPNIFLVFLFFLSLFWTQQVIKNVVHVTVAGTVGTWWFVPEEASSCCSKGVQESFFRSITFSFGSICLGSLLVAIIQSLKRTFQSMRQQDDGLLICCAECCLACIEAIAEYFNEWAFVFVGVYGYSFTESAKNVITLFRTRGWTTIITDTLIDNVLMMVSAGVGLLTGLAGVLVVFLQGVIIESSVATFGTAFGIGFFIGFVLATILMGIVASAVNTVIVCYAEAPNEFQTNHPELSERMRDAWRRTWPSEFQY